jgi:hypothetical protein
VRDIDFDEIDKAVSSAISNVPAPGEPTEESQVASVPAAAVPAPSPVPTQAPVIPPVAARRSSGQFMDVVHPSSNMRRNSVGVPERVVTQPTVAEKQPVPTPPIVPAVENIPPVSAVPVEDSYDAADIDKISDEINKELGEKPDSTLESPFIAGTKVEKRPLGAFSTEPQPGTDSDKNEAVAEFAPEPVVAKSSESLDTGLPAELQKDLLEVESDSSTDPNAPEAVDEPVQGATLENTAESTTPKVEPAAEPVVAAAEVAPVASESANNSEMTVPTDSAVSKQPADGNRDSGAIYDTNSYHKSLVHPMKTKPRLMWLAYLAILLVVGAAIGAAVFYFVIPSLNGL